MQQSWTPCLHVLVLGLYLALVGSLLVDRVHCRRSRTRDPYDNDAYGYEDVEHERDDRSWAKRVNYEQGPGSPMTRANSPLPRQIPFSAEDQDAALDDDEDSDVMMAVQVRRLDDEGTDEGTDEGVNRVGGKECKGATCEFRSECGQAPLNQFTRKRTGKGSYASYIVNGEPQVYGEWPSFAQLRIVWNFWGTTGNCGGVIISDRHILTAGHCMHHDSFGMAKADKISAVLGEDMLWEADNYEKVYPVESFCMAKKYLKSDTNNQTQYDYAVLTLKDRIQFSDYHQPACLPYARMKTNSTMCYLVGGGAVYVKPDGDIFRSISVQKMRVREVSCEVYGFGYKDKSRECYTKLGSAGDSCVGDSGAPILCLDPDTKRWTLMATVSYGSMRCNGKETQGWTAVYSRISTLLPDLKADCGV